MIMPPNDEARKQNIKLNNVIKLTRFLRHISLPFKFISIRHILLILCNAINNFVIFHSEKQWFPRYL